MAEQTPQLTGIQRGQVVRLEPGMQIVVPPSWRVVIVTIDSNGIPTHEAELNSYEGKDARANAMAFATGYNLGGLNKGDFSKVAIVEGSETTGAPR